MRTHTHRSKANLEVRQHLALAPVDHHYKARHATENDQDVNQRPELIVGRTGSQPLGVQITGELLKHQRSTSPRTMSSVPITATTSAINMPRTILSKPCKFTNDGGRIRMR